MMVKICGITSQEDAEAAAGAGASALGFNFWPRSPRYVPPERLPALLAAVPPGVWKVGVFVSEPPENVAAAAARFGLDIVQLHGGEAPAGLRVWRALASDHLSFDETPQPDAYLVDSPAGEGKGGTGRSFDWTLVRETRRRIVLAGGLDASNVRQAIQAAKPWGVDACSRLESSPGKKDHARVRDFVKEALAEGALC
jgi:phosphoribosylanthranilate isomerase